MAGGSPEADALEAPAGARPSGPGRQPEVVALAVLCAAASIVFGILPSPLFDAARDAGSALAGLL